jgi:uncharacterized protein DUF2304
VPSLLVLTVDVAAVLLIVWLLNLIRRNRLYVGYGAIFVLVIGAGMIALSVPPILARINRLGPLLVAASGLVVLVLAFLVLMLIYVLGQLTLLSHRVNALAQELAIRRVAEGEPAVPDDDRVER